MGLARKRRMDSSICRMPPCRPLVQTFVATKSLPSSFSSVARSPTTFSDRPYMGEESITVPPNRTNSRNTSRKGARSDCADPTSKVCQVPSPMTGSDSPVREIGLVNIGLDEVAAPMAAPPALIKIPAPTASRSNSRREMANRSVTSGCAVCLSVIMNETRERLNCVASLSVERKITLRKPLVGISSEDLAIEVIVAYDTMASDDGRLQFQQPNFRSPSCLLVCALWDP